LISKIQSTSKTTKYTQKIFPIIHNLKIYDRFWTCVAQRDGVEPPPKGGTTTQALL
jgi:hypothetical protein